MVKHIILWKLKDEYTAEQKESIKNDIKKGIEGLAGQIDGLVDIRVDVCGLGSSTVDLMLDSTFADETHLKATRCIQSTLPLPIRTFALLRRCAVVSITKFNGFCQRKTISILPAKMSFNAAFICVLSFLVGND